MSLQKIQNDLVQIEVSLDKLEELFSKGELCAADLHCLNSKSKERIWNICLTSCANKMGCKLNSRSISKSCLSSINNYNNNLNIEIEIKRKNLTQFI